MIHIVISKAPSCVINFEFSLCSLLHQHFVDHYVVFNELNALHHKHIDLGITKWYVLRIFSGIIYCIILMCVNFIFFYVYCKLHVSQLVESFNLRNNSSFHFDAGFGCQRLSITPEIRTETVIKTFHSIVWKCMNCQHFEENIHSFYIALFIPVHIHIYYLFYGYFFMSCKV